MVLVVGADGDGVVGIVGFVAEAVESGQGELVDVIDCGGVFGFGRDQAKAGAEVEEDVGELTDGQVAVPEDRRGEVWRVGVRRGGLRDQGLQGAHAIFGGIGGIAVGGQGRFEAKADGLAAAGDSRPVEEFERRRRGRGGGGGAGTFGSGRRGHVKTIDGRLVAMVY